MNAKRLRASIVGFAVEFIRIIVLSLAIILPVRYFLVQPFYVKGASMEPNFYDHEYLIINEIGYRFREPQRGDIIVLRFPKDPKQFFIKRIVGLPGETVFFSGGIVRIQNAAHPKPVAISEPYLSERLRVSGDSTRHLEANEYYVLGDNRANSYDSEEFGPVDRKLIVGRVWIRGWPFSNITVFHTPQYPELQQQQTP